MAHRCSFPSFLQFLWNKLKTMVCHMSYLLLLFTHGSTINLYMAPYLFYTNVSRNCMHVLHFMLFHSTCTTYQHRKIQKLFFKRPKPPNACLPMFRSITQSLNLNLLQNCITIHNCLMLTYIHPIMNLPVINQTNKPQKKLVHILFYFLPITIVHLKWTISIR